MKELFNCIIKLDIKNLFLADSNNAWIQFFRYVFIGGLAFLVDWLFLYVFANVGLHYLISAAIAFLAGLIVNYILSTKFIFKQASETLNSKLEFAWYAIIGVIGLLITEILMFVLTDLALIHFMLSKIVSAAIVLIWNFSARKLLLYRSI